MTDQPKTGLELMRVKFEPHQISKLPKPTKQQTDAVKADYKKGIRCKLCGGWHHPDVVHLDYVGHAALTDRLLNCDINWQWEPLSYNADGSPFFDKIGGLWIKLTVCGVTRLGYGHPDGKTGGDAHKEAIGDALRNAAMRFGAALDLWHKGDLHNDGNEPEAQPEAPKVDNADTKPEQTPERETYSLIAKALKSAKDFKTLNQIWTLRKADIEKLPEAGRAALEGIYQDQLDKLNTVGAG